MREGSGLKLDDLYVESLGNKGEICLQGMTYKGKKIALNLALS